LKEGKQKHDMADFLPDWISTAFKSEQSWKFSLEAKFLSIK